MSSDAPDVSLILEKIRRGQPDAAAHLFAAVYDELKRIGRWRLRGEAPGNTLQTTALVNEAYLRLVGDDGSGGWENRGHFFGAAAEAMRRILVDRARSKARIKRGGGKERVPLDDGLAGTPEDDVDIIALDEALAKLESFDPRRSSVVKHRYFLGLTVSETADCLGVSPRTVDDDWAFAKAWLRREIQDRPRQRP